MSLTVWLAVGGLVVGGGLGAGITAKLMKRDEVAVIVDKTAETQQEVIMQLTDLDLVQEPCSADFIKENNNLLCRELFCRMQQRGIDAQTSGTECEQIANVSNTITIFGYCKDQGEQMADCIQVFRERK
jgi:hypothetical protein